MSEINTHNCPRKFFLLLTIGSIILLVLTAIFYSQEMTDAGHAIIVATIATSVAKLIAEVYSKYKELFNS